MTLAELCSIRSISIRLEVVKLDEAKRGFVLHSADYHAATNTLSAELGEPGSQKPLAAN